MPSQDRAPLAAGLGERRADMTGARLVGVMSCACVAAGRIAAAPAGAEAVPTASAAELALGDTKAVCSRTAVDSTALLALGNADDPAPVCGEGAALPEPLVEVCAERRVALAGDGGRSTVLRERDDLPLDVAGDSGVVATLSFACLARVVEPEGLDGLGPVPFVGDDESVDAESVDPVSARATAGSEMIAAPTPRATASAPTLPTWPDAGSG